MVRVVRHPDIILHPEIVNFSCVNHFLNFVRIHFVSSDSIGVIDYELGVRCQFKGVESQRCQTYETS